MPGTDKQNRPVLTGGLQFLLQEPTTTPKVLSRGEHIKASFSTRLFMIPLPFPLQQSQESLLLSREVFLMTLQWVIGGPLQIKTNILIYFQVHQTHLIHLSTPWHSILKREYISTHFMNPTNIYCFYLFILLKDYYFLKVAQQSYEVIPCKALK